ncbi:MULTISPECIES: type B 50S ribosomal protein L31 [Pandoraea]|uniref:50S ribosomal protein L31 n=2 Tax=Pandoraea TaxID=93217 RepID=A0A5E4WEP6_9BURK|nr:MULTISPECIES: type B 50S ribosomal protein L31 [Pandoraea]ALS61237.1 50S ribosomal protein L31 [Pandoraea norimbergensis]VVE13677.1 50S ribosomal protein L31 [Pandoraea iniqua]VVE21880.1 50S ribosomal protein L31 [Pandoraea iniqua]
MKEGIHPNYREVVFKDMTPGIDFQFISRSTIQTKETVEIDGKSYPLVKLDTSSASHNFYTGETRIMDAEGRVDKFKKKFGTRAGGKVA